MGRKIDRTGEERYNNFGSRMIITKYNNKDDIDVYFPEYNWTFKHTIYNNFKRGNIKCVYEPRTYGIGYLGEGKYKVKENGKQTKCYDTWHDMLRRCYDPKYQEREPAYKDCEVCDKWLNFQTFAKWFDENYYEIPECRMELDKDILIKGNKIYSRDKCIFVPQNINSLFTKCNKSRGNDPIGTHQLPSGNYQVQCNNINGLDYLGTYSNKEEAFRVYKQYKEKIIKQRADEYKQYLPQNVYEALYNYQVEITD